MQTQEDIEQGQAAKRASAKEFYRNVLKAAERYERLMENDDFKAVVKDIEDVVKTHDGQIRLLVDDLASGQSFFKELRTLAVLRTHGIRRQQAQEAVALPQRIVQSAIQAREALEVIKQEESNAARN